MDDIPRNLFVNVRWTDSNLLIAVTEHGDQTGEQYSSKGRTYVINVRRTEDTHALTSIYIDYFAIISKLGSC